MRNKLSALDRLRILVLGYIVRGPFGGLVWHHLQYVLGLARLGHDVYFFEDSGDAEWWYYDPSSNTSSKDPSYGLRFVDDAFRDLGLDGRWTYYDAHHSRWVGPCADRALGLAASADVVLNLSGVNPLRPWLKSVPVRALIDTDPVFTQIDNLTKASICSETLQHTAFFTFAENFGSPCCTVPDDGFSWIPTRQPVVLDVWPFTAGPREGKFTTVMAWRSYPGRKHQDRWYGMKADSFDPYLDFPARAHDGFELALTGHDAPYDLLRDRGWSIRNPHYSAPRPSDYQDYIRQSKAEFSVAKHGYVVSQSGWFSERTAVYLASGRPAVVQDTGFTNWLPAGCGVLAFDNPSEAAVGIEEINRRYEHHCREARVIAEEYFDARKVLASLLDRAVHRPGRGRERAAPAAPARGHR